MADTESSNDRNFIRDQNAEAAPQGADGGDSPDSAARSYTGGRKAVFFVMLAVIAALVGLARYASHWQKEVVVREVVVDGLSIVSRRDLASSLKGYQGQNLQALDQTELKKRIVALPYVRDALISKELNGIVRIKVIERVPVALTVIDGRIMAIDRDGFLLPGRVGYASRVPKLLEVRGISRLKAAANGLQQLDQRDRSLLLQFLDALSESEYAALLIREFHFADNNETFCTAVQAPTRFIVGNDGNFKEKLKKFEIFWQKVVSKKGFGTYDTVDLRFRDRIFTRDPASPEVPQVNPL
jgi:cell division protein FtsQ